MLPHDEDEAWRTEAFEQGAQTSADGGGMGLGEAGDFGGRAPIVKCGDEDEPIVLGEVFGPAKEGFGVVALEASSSVDAAGGRDEVERGLGDGGHF